MVSKERFIKCIERFKRFTISTIKVDKLLGIDSAGSIFNDIIMECGDILFSGVVGWDEIPGPGESAPFDHVLMIFGSIFQETHKLSQQIKYMMIYYML